jgi:Flp pilus assembly protein TadB
VKIHEEPDTASGQTEVKNGQWASEHDNRRDGDRGSTMARVYVNQQGRPGLGCLGSVLALAALVGVIVAAIFVGIFVLAIVAGVLIIGAIVMAIDRLMLALSPKRRQRRAHLQRSLFGRPGVVIDATATLEERRSDPPSDL